MTDSSERFALLLADLWGRDGKPELIVREVEFKKPIASTMFLGVDAKGQRHVLAPIAEDYAFKPDQGESIELTDWRDPNVGTRYLDLLCNDELLAKPFEQLTGSIIDRIENKEAPHIAIQEAIKDMKSLLKPGRLLSQEIARGIFGELVVLSWLAERNAHFAVEAWRGPDGHVHDFSTQSRDLEVKASGSDSHSVVISSLRQLDEVADTPLALVRLHVPAAPQGQNLEDMVEKVVTLGCNRADVVTKLEDAGFRLGIDSDDNRFVVTNEALAWQVGPLFPGLRSTDLPEERGEAIRQVKYTLDLLGAPDEMTADELGAYLDGMMTA